MNAPNVIESSPFSRLAAINVNEHTEKKNGLTYLSWAWAWAELMKADPTASVEYHDAQKFGKDTYMVSCTVTAFGIPRRMFLPVMDHRNKAIPDPDAFQFNTAMMRCLVKAIALHGLGLYIYAGEDLPDGEDKPAIKPANGTITPTTGAWEAMDADEQAFLTEISMEVIAILAEGKPDEAMRFLDSKHLQPEEKVAIWTRFDSKQRSAMKTAAKPQPTPEDYLTTA